MGEAWRLFVAVAVPTEVAESIAEFASKSLAGRAGWKTIPPGLLHFTLKFLGNTDSDRQEPLGAALVRAAQAPQFALELSGVGVFPNKHHPKILWVGTTAGADELTALATYVDTELQAEGVPKEERPFVPHLTVARNKHGGRARDIPQRPTPTWAFTVRELILYRSELSDQGPRYTPIVTAPLRSP